ISTDDLPVCPGDQLLVCKCAFDGRTPRRWEVAVFRTPAEPGKVFVKRVVGLPGETIQIKEGDLYIDHDLARKSADQVRALRVPLFDMNYQPPGGWSPRWQPEPSWWSGCVEDNHLRLHALDSPDEYRWLIYRNWLLDENKADTIRDEYSYNGKKGG